MHVTKYFTSKVLCQVNTQVNLRDYQRASSIFIHTARRQSNFEFAYVKILFVVHT